MCDGHALEYEQMPTCARPRPVLGAQATPIQCPLPALAFQWGTQVVTKSPPRGRLKFSLLSAVKARKRSRQGEGGPRLSRGVSQASQVWSRTGARVPRAGAAAGVGAQEAAACGLEEEQAQQEGGRLERRVEAELGGFCFYLFLFIF